MKTYLEALWKNPAAARKAIVALLGVVVQVALLAFPHAAWLPVVIAVATAFGVYHVRNDRVDPRKVGKDIMEYRGRME